MILELICHVLLLLFLLLNIRINSIHYTRNSTKPIKDKIGEKRCKTEEEKEEVVKLGEDELEVRVDVVIFDLQVTATTNLVK